MLYTPRETSPLLLFRLSGGKKSPLQTVSYLYRSAACLQACSGLSLGWVAGFTGLPLLPSEGQSERNSMIWAQQWKQFSWADIYVVPYRQLPHQCSSPKILLFVQDVFRLNSDSLSLRFRHNVQKQVRSSYGHSDCNLVYFRFLSSNFCPFQYVCFGSLPSNLVTPKQY